MSKKKQKDGTAKKATPKVEMSKKELKQAEKEAKLKAKAKTAKKADKVKGEGWFKGIKGELKRVSWPNWETVKSNTITVVTVLLMIGVFVYILDVGFGAGSRALIQTKAASEPTATVAPPAVTAPVVTKVVPAKATPKPATKGKK